MTDERVAWLRQQIDADEQAARAAEPADDDLEFGDVSNPWTDPHGEFRGRGGPIFEHVLRHSPARVLAEVDAKRRRLHLIESILENPPTRDDGPWAAEAYKGDALVAYGLLRFEALSYADRPGYREEWRPE